MIFPYQIGPISLREIKKKTAYVIVSEELSKSLSSFTWPAVTPFSTANVFLLESVLSVASSQTVNEWIDFMKSDGTNQHFAYSNQFVPWLTNLLPASLVRLPC